MLLMQQREDSNGIIIRFCHMDSKISEKVQMESSGLINFCSARWFVHQCASFLDSCLPISTASLSRLGVQ